MDGRRVTVTKPSRLLATHLATVALMARVLVVDDDSDINLALQSALKIAGYEADGAVSGADDSCSFNVAM